jgi:hypothetical protein
MLSAFEKAQGDEVEIEVSRQPLSWWRERWADRKIQQQFIEGFLKIRDSFDENELRPFILTDLQKHLHFNHKGKDVILKGRGAQVSRYWLAKRFADCVVMSGRKLRVIPHEPELEEEFFTDLKIFYENLPAHLKPFTRYYSKELIYFHDPGKGTIGSSISTMCIQPKREGKGRGQSITDLIATEMPFWNCDSAKAMKNLLQSMRGKGTVVSESTAGGLEFHNALYVQGKRNEAGWTSHFFGWWWNRHYRIEGAEFCKEKLFIDSFTPASELSKAEIRIAKVIYRHLRKHKYLAKPGAWMCDEVAEYIAWRRKKIEEIGAQMFVVEYPENDRDCFEQSGRPLLAAEFLKATCRAAEAKDGREYLIGCDPSGGLDKGNPGAIEIADITTGKQVFELLTKDKPEVVARRLCDLSDEYNGAMIIVERNGLGLAVINAIIRNGYEDRLFKQLTMAQKRSVDEGEMTTQEAWEKAQFGLQTSQTIKQLMGYSLERQIRSGELGLSSESFCENAKRVVWFDNGGWGVKSGTDGYHGDDVIALSLIAYVREYEMGTQAGFIGVLPEMGKM